MGMFPQLFMSQLTAGFEQTLINRIFKNVTERD